MPVMSINPRKRSHDGSVLEDLQDPRRTGGKRQKIYSHNDEIQITGTKRLLPNPGYGQSSMAQNMQFPHHHSAQMPPGYYPDGMLQDFNCELMESQKSQYTQQFGQMGHHVHPIQPTKTYSAGLQQAVSARGCVPSATVGSPAHPIWYASMYAGPPSSPQPSRSQRFQPVAGIQDAVTSQSGGQVQNLSSVSPRPYVPNLCPGNATHTAVTYSPVQTSRGPNLPHVTCVNKRRNTVVNQHTLGAQRKAQPSRPPWPLLFQHEDGFQRPLTPISIVESVASKRQSPPSQAQQHDVADQIRIFSTPPSNPSQKPTPEPTPSSPPPASDPSKESSSPNAEQEHIVQDVIEPLLIKFVPDFDVPFSDDHMAYLKLLERPIVQDPFSNLDIARALEKEANEDFANMLENANRVVELDKRSKELEPREDLRSKGKHTEREDWRVAYEKGQLIIQAQQKREFQLMAQKHQEEKARKAREKEERENAARRKDEWEEELRVEEEKLARVRESSRAEDEQDCAQEAEETRATKPQQHLDAQKTNHVIKQPKLQQASDRPLAQEQQRRAPEPKITRVPQQAQQQQQAEKRRKNQPTANHDQSAKQTKKKTQPPDPNKPKCTPMRRLEQSVINSPGSHALESLLQKRDDVLKVKWEWSAREETLRGSAKRNVAGKIRTCVKKLDKLRELIIAAGGEAHTNE